MDQRDSELILAFVVSCPLGLLIYLLWAFRQGTAVILQTLLQRQPAVGWQVRRESALQHPKQPKAKCLHPDQTKGMMGNTQAMLVVQSV